MACFGGRYVDLCQYHAHITGVLDPELNSTGFTRVLVFIFCSQYLSLHHCGINSAGSVRGWELKDSSEFGQIYEYDLQFILRACVVWVAAFAKVHEAKFLSNSSDHLNSHRKMCRAFEECAGCEAECAAGNLNVPGNRMYASQLKNQA
ncbi:hypothetical protein B0H13DRAFT_1866562 [Mycena leptocephala]|nr:hypothetical protein B0H13DRAFT_1866562 [Mycena leptocephala]